MNLEPKQLNIIRNIFVEFSRFKSIKNFNIETLILMRDIYRNLKIRTPEFISVGIKEKEEYVEAVSKKQRLLKELEEVEKKLGEKDQAKHCVNLDGEKIIESHLFKDIEGQEPCSPMLEKMREQSQSIVNVGESLSKRETEPTRSEKIKNFLSTLEVGDEQVFEVIEDYKKDFMLLSHYARKDGMKISGKKQSETSFMVERKG